MTEIPKMDYVIVSKNDIDTIDDTIRSIRMQRNVNRIILVLSIDAPLKQLKYVKHAMENRIIDKLIMEDKGLAYARYLGIQEVQTIHFVFVDADVKLSNVWIERMWPYVKDNAAIHGRLYRNAAHARYLNDYELLSVPVKTRMFTHNTIIRTRYVLDWEPDPKLNAFEDYALTQHIIEKGGSIYKVPVLGRHQHQGSDFKAAMWAGAGARISGRYTRFRDVVKDSIKLILGGVKRTLKMNNDWFTMYALRQGLGMMWGYIRYEKYRKKAI